MKKFVISFSVLFFSSVSLSQIDEVAPDFTVTDINGGNHNLYSYLNSGKLVILDVSTTWCGPCWGFHEEHYLKDLHNEFGPNGTDQIVVLFYEGDVSTTMADLNGTGQNTHGDWVSGTPYPIINEDVLTLDLNVYSTGFPTINLICPSDKIIKADLFYALGSTQSESLENMRAIVLDYINSCSTLEVSENDDLIQDISIAPNPFDATTSITFTSNSSETVVIQLVDITGKELSSFSHQLIEGDNVMELDLSAFESGNYFVKISNNNFISKMLPVVKR